MQRFPDGMRQRSKAGTPQGVAGSTPAGDAPRSEASRGGSLAVASSTPATQLLLPAKMLKLNHTQNDA